MPEPRRLHLVRGYLAAVILLFPVYGPGQSLTPEETARHDELDARPLSDFRNVDLGELLSLRNRRFEGNRPDPADEIGYYARKGLRQPLRLGALRFAYQESDCVVAVERSVAMALAWDWDSYYRLSERLRHKGGKIDFLERNFFTLADWVPEQCSWLMRDITQDLAPTREFEHVVRRKAFYAGLSFGEDDTDKGRAKAAAKAAKVAAAPDKEYHIDSYIVREDVPIALPGLKTGDICLTIRRYEKPGLKPWRDCDHLGIVVCDPGAEPMLVCPVGRDTRQVELIDFLKYRDYVDGFKFLRLRPDARSIVAQELQRMGEAENVPAPAAVDGKNDKVRAVRDH